MSEAVSSISVAQPSVIVKGKLSSNIKEAILVVEKKIICLFPAKDTTLLLISAFYVFNMHYTVGCTNLFSFFDVIFFKQKKPTKKTRLAAVIAKLL